MFVCTSAAKQWDAHQIPTMMLLLMQKTCLSIWDTERCDADVTVIVLFFYSTIHPCMVESRKSIDILAHTHIHLNTKCEIIKRTFSLCHSIHSITALCCLLTWIISTFSKWCSHIDKPK